MWLRRGISILSIGTEITEVWEMAKPAARILIVDEEKISCTVLSSLLKSEGIDAPIAALMAL